MRKPGRGVVVRSVTIAALWSMVAALIGALVVVLAGLVGAAIVGIAWLVSNGRADLADTALIWRVATVATWIVAPISVFVAVWVSAYASTEWGSRPRALVGTAAAGLALGAYLLLGSSGLVVAGLGLGWAVAIPAERISRVAVRGTTGLLVALVAPGLAALPGPTLAVLLVVSPWLAALLVWVSDRVWVLVDGWFGRPDGA